MSTPRRPVVAEKSWALRFATVTVLSGLFAVTAHLGAGGALGSSEGLVLGALSAVLVSMVALYRRGFWRVFGAMAIGQFAFHTFMEVGSTGPAHHHHVVEPLVSSGASSVMGASHLVAALASAFVVSGADRALRGLVALIQVLRARVVALFTPLAPVAGAPLTLGESFHYQPFASRDLVGSHGLRGPPQLFLSA